MSAVNPQWLGWLSARLENMVAGLIYDLGSFFLRYENSEWIGFVSFSSRTNNSMMLVWENHHLSDGCLGKRPVAWK